MYLSQVESGAPGGGRGGCGALVADLRASVGGSCRHQRAVTRVRSYLVFIISQTLSFRLNVHLSSIVASKPFQMPVEVLPRASYT